MHWITHYQLFLFDFDGLLVDTEHLHYQAYIHMCEQRGFKLNWNFHRYSEAAHHKSTGLRDQIYAEFPELYAEQPDWQVLYEEKKNIFLHLITQKEVPLMPGVKELLFALERACIKRCVVTHSAASLIKRIRKQNPILDSIPHWLTREDYTQPKPHPECYQTAIANHSQNQDNIIGLEDSPRGLEALLGTRAIPTLICPSDAPYLSTILNRDSFPKSIHYYPSLLAINDANAPRLKYHG